MYIFFVSCVFNLYATIYLCFRQLEVVHIKIYQHFVKINGVPIVGCPKKMKVLKSQWGTL